jgi:hypothetical protein
VRYLEPQPTRLLIRDEARRTAANIAKLPELSTSHLRECSGAKTNPERHRNCHPFHCQFAFRRRVSIARRPSWSQSLRNERSKLRHQLSARFACGTVWVLIAATLSGTLISKPLL